VSIYTKLRTSSTRVMGRGMNWRRLLQFFVIDKFVLPVPSSMTPPVSLCAHALSVMSAVFVLMLLFTSGSVGGGFH